MIREGKAHGREIFRDPNTQLWYVRVPVEQGGFGAVHDMHKRVCIGRQRTFTDACAAARRWAQ